MLARSQLSRFFLISQKKITYDICVNYIAMVIQLLYIIVTGFIQVMAASFWYQNNWTQ